MNAQTEYLVHPGPAGLLELAVDRPEGPAQGVAVIARAFVERDIKAGRLQLLVEDDDREGYFLVTRPGPQRSAVRAFVAWVLRQAEAGDGAVI